MDNKGRFVIGFLISGLSDPFSREMGIGVLQRAEEEDVSVVILPGKFINRDLQEEIRYEYQYNTLFKMVTENNIDAVIVSADSIGNYSDRSGISQFIHYYDDIPCVLVASKEEGKSCVTYDNYNGIKEGIEYLIDHNHCTKFAMIGGTESNTDSIERKESLLRLLKEKDIPFDESVNYVSGNLSRRSADAARKLLDQNPDVQAIFCVNDDTALSLYEVMKERDLVPGKDIYVLGYDNSKESGQIRPTLSSIWADPVELARQAFDMALNLLRGRKTPSRKLDTMFVKRDSLGEDTTHVDLAAMDEKQIKSVYNKIFYRLQGARGKEYKAYQVVIRDCIDIIRSVEYNKTLHRRLLGDFELAVDTGMLQYADMEFLQLLIDDIYTQISEGEGIRKDRREVREGYGYIFRLLVGCQEERIREITQRNQSLDYSLKLVAQDIMRFENGNDINYTVLLRKLPLMGVHNAYLYMLEKPVVHLDGEEWELPEYLYLKAMLKDDVSTHITATKQKIDFNKIYRNEYIGDDRYNMTLLPLYSNESVYGFLLADISTRMFENGEVLISQISAAVKMIQVLKNTEEVKSQLEESMVTLRQNNIMLDNMSKEDVMTGILNRRGFMSAAEACLSAAYETFIPVMVMYIDMDNLKIVNDRFGHDEGDFSLKLIANILKEKVGDKGALGRIGGDEFAALVWSDYEADEFKEQIRKTFEEYNRTSDKQYTISASIGIYRIPELEQVSLEEALARADEDLYLEKKKRTKHAVKPMLNNKKV